MTLVALVLFPVVVRLMLRAARTVDPVTLVAAYHKPLHLVSTLCQRSRDELSAVSNAAWDAELKKRGLAAVAALGHQLVREPALASQPN